MAAMETPWALQEPDPQIVERVTLPEKFGGVLSVIKWIVARLLELGELFAADTHQGANVHLFARLLCPGAEVSPLAHSVWAPYAPGR